MGVIEVLKWEPAPHVFAFHYPNCQLNYKSQLIVTEGQEAVLVKEGLYYGPIEPGRHTLETKNFPFLTKLSTALVSDAKSPYTAEIWFVQKSVPLDIKWGTSDPVLIEDPKYHIALPIRAFGQYGLKIVDTCRFLATLYGRVPAFTEITLANYFKGVIITRTKNAIATIIAEKQCSLLSIGARLDEISAELEKRISVDLAEYGVELRLFMVNSISTDEHDPSVAQLKKALAKKAEMEIIGYSYTQERSFDTLKAAAENEGTGGAALGTGMGLGIGVGVGAPMGNAMASIAGNINPASTQPGVATTVKRSSNRFCPNCGTALPEGAKFCPGCGAKN